MVVRVSMLGSPLHAIHVVRLATFDLYLDGHVGYAEMILQLLCYRAQYVLSASHALLFHRNMATTTNDARANCPNVEIMNC